MIKRLSEAVLTITIGLDGTVPGVGVFIGWSPRKATITLSDLPAGAVPIPLTVSSTGAQGRLVFTTDATVRGTSQVNFTIDPANPTVSFFYAGDFSFASLNKDDAQMTVSASTGGAPVVATQNVTVRVRKNANTLSPTERDIFLNAIATVNDAGTGPYQAIRDMHAVQLALIQAHNSQQFKNSHFLPWHRAYLLDLERHLQAVEPSMALPYWKFDEKAQKVFSPDFMGSTSSGSIQLSPSNKLNTWRVDDQIGISRLADFNEQNQTPIDLFPNNVLDEANVINLGNQYSAIKTIEQVAHNYVHGSFENDLSVPATAPKDPMFFLLHCNVDRLWALWQYHYSRYDSTQSLTYDLQGRSSAPNKVGRMSLDTMWPWDGVVGGNQRPPDVPRAGGLPNSPSEAAPGAAPSISSMIDYQGKLNPASLIGFDYDVVPYW